MKKWLSALRQFGWGYLLFACLELAAGVCMILFPSVSIDGMCYAVGGMTVAVAIVEIVLTLAAKSRGVGFFGRILLSVLGILAGGYILLFRAEALEYFAVTVAFLVILDCGFKLQTSVNAKAAGVRTWWAMTLLTVAVALAAGGLMRYQTEDPVSHASYLGAVLLLDGILNLLTPFYLGAIRRRTQLPCAAPVPPTE